MLVFFLIIVLINHNQKYIPNIFLSNHMENIETNQRILRKTSSKGTKKHAHVFLQLALKLISLKKTKRKVFRGFFKKDKIGKKYWGCQYLYFVYLMSAFFARHLALSSVLHCFLKAMFTTRIGVMSLTFHKSNHKLMSRLLFSFYFMFINASIFLFPIIFICKLLIHIFSMNKPIS